MHTSIDYRNKVTLLLHTHTHISTCKDIPTQVSGKEKVVKVFIVEGEREIHKIGESSHTVYVMMFLETVLLREKILPLFPSLSPKGREKNENVNFDGGANDSHTSFSSNGL